MKEGMGSMGAKGENPRTSGLFLLSVGLCSSMQLGELHRLNDGKDRLLMEQWPQRVWKEGPAWSEAQVFIFRQSPELTHPVGQSSLGEPSVLHFGEKAPETSFVLLSVLSSPVAMARAEQAGVPTCGPGT